MTICPIALAVGCKKCPAFKVCPLKATLGDFRPGDPPAAEPAGKPGTAKTK